MGKIAYIIITREASKSRRSLCHGRSPLATALLRDLRDRRGRMSRRGNSGVAAARDGNRRSTTHLGRAVGDRGRLVEAELNILVSTNKTAVCAVASRRVGTNRHRALAGMVGTAVDDGTAARDGRASDRDGRGDVRSAVHRRGNRRLAILTSRRRGTNHNGRLRARRDQRGRCRLLVRTGGGSIRRSCGS